VTAVSCSHAVRLLFVVFAACVALTLSGCQPRSAATSRPAGTALVVRVVDGDTLDVDIDGSTVRVRLLGIDTPETVDQNRPVQCFGHEASAYLAQLLPKGTAVRLERDAEARDRYGRLLVYLYRIDDGLFVNAALLEGGFATTLSIAPNTMRARNLEVLRLQSQRDKIGLWGACLAFGSPIDAAPTTRG
jgi:micrococcal nuclease